MGKRKGRVHERDAAAVADDDLIASLSKKLAKDDKTSKKLKREYEKELGSGFGDFLDDLDAMEERLGVDDDKFDDDEQDDSDGSSSSDSYSEGDDIEDDLVDFNDVDDDGPDNDDDDANPSQYGASSSHYDMGAEDDDFIIKKLSKKLAKGSGKGKLKKEWGEEMGEGFADFMDELDGLGDRLGVPEDEPEASGDDSDSDSDGDGGYASSDSGADDFPPVDSKDTYAPTPGEDIYGRIAPSSAPTSAPGAYVPPHLRKKMQAAKSKGGEVDSRLKGTLNRLSEKNIIPIIRTVKSSPLPNWTVLATFRSSLSNLNKIGKDSDVRQNTGFAFIISCVSAGAQWANVGVVLAEEAYKEVIKASGTSVESSDGVNAVAVLSAYFLLGHLSSQLIIGMADHIASKYDAKTGNANNILVILNFMLDAMGLKLARDFGEDERSVRDLVEDKVDVIVAGAGKGSWMKDSCMEKLKHLVKSKKKLSKHLESHGIITDPDRTNRIVKEVRETCGDSKEGRALKAEDFRDVEKKGRWWKLGGVYNKDGLDGGGDETTAADSAVSSTGMARGGDVQLGNEEEDRITTLAKKMKMNTAFKKKVFRTLLSSFDHLEFSANVNSMNLSHKDTREVVRVVVEVCGREKKFNTFYVSILRDMLEDDRKEHKMTINLSYKDSLKNLDTSKRARNLGILAANLVGLQGLDFVYAFADVDFRALSPEEIVFFVYFFGTAFQELSISEVESLVTIIITKDKGMASDIRKFVKESLEGWKGNLKDSMWRQSYKRVLKLLKL